MKPEDLIDVTDIMENFQNFLIASSSYLNKSNVVYGEDPFDDFSEFNFKLMVASLIEELHGVKIENLYGAWFEDYENEIIAIPTTKGVNPSFFYFREFRSEFNDAEAKLPSQFKCVAGVATKDQILDDAVETDGYRLIWPKSLGSVKYYVKKPK